MCVMSLLLCLVSSCFLLLYFFVTVKTRSSSRGSSRATLPPGPPKLPVVGNIFQVGYSPHRSLTALSKIYGPIMGLKLGSLTTIVISSPEAAKEALKTQDHHLSARTFNDPVRVFDHHEYSVAWGPPSARWRLLRKTTTMHLLSTQRLNAMEPLRMKKVEELMSFINKCCEREEAVDIARAFFVTALNIISNALFSTDFATHDSKSSHEYHNTVISLMNVTGKPNVGDYFPFLRFLDLQGTRKEATLCTQRLFKVFQDFMNARMAKKSSHTKDISSFDMLDTLLDLTQENKAELSLNDIKHFLQDLFTAGTDTNSSTMEWVMSELIRNPEKMVKAQSEIRQVIGENGVVQESDIPRLPYLQAIVKETLRLHPAAPLIPRKSESDVHIFGFLIPKNASVLVNVLAIGRDSSVWENPTRFEPERFLLREIDVKGKDFELIPFGAGRRMCPGMSMALRTMSLVLASLLYSFDWKAQKGVVAENMDMTDAFGVTLRKAKPLRAVPTKRSVRSSL
ncbi:cytochrome P450 76C3-like [Brassica napus]|uniref:cytochrome P450 76C3-like n=1 Tax=Brassica napus TaxID=3708 RepID=UPI0006AB0B83|nr:cytochrome P450 76C3-like [Brassica napus]